MSLDLRLALTDQPVGELPWKLTCPPEIHKERTGRLDKEMSLAVYPDNIHCFGCKFHRNQPDEALAILLGITPEQALPLLPRYHSESIDAYRERAAQEANLDPLPASLAEVYHQMLWSGPRQHRMKWLQARGLSKYSIQHWQLGHDGNRFVIPLWGAEGQLLTLRYRRDDEYLDDKYPKYSGMKGRNGLYLFGGSQPGDGTAIWVTEGELDAIRLWQEGINAVSATNGAGQVHKLPKMIRERWPLVQTLYIATDQDEPGHEAARLTKLSAEALGFQTHRISWDGEAKDVTEALQLGYLDHLRYGSIAA
jgi:DNA primase